MASPKAGLAFASRRARALPERGRGLSQQRRARRDHHRRPAERRGRRPRAGAGEGPRRGDGLALPARRDFTFTVALWQLKLDSELVYVGDAGTTEPGRASSRRGMEATLRWKFDRAWRWRWTARCRARASRGARPRAKATTSTTRSRRCWPPASPTRRAAGPRRCGCATWARARSTRTNTVRSRPPRCSTWARATRQQAAHAGPGRVQPGRQEGQRHRIRLRLVHGGRSGERRCGGGVDDRHVHPMEPRTARVSARWTF
jgi:hypothetical protein